MNVVHVTRYCHAAGHGGTERYILDLIRCLRKQGVRGHIAWLCQNRPPDASEAAGVRIVPLKSPPSEVDPVPRRFGREALNRARDDGGIDWLHFHTFGLAEAALAAAATEEGIPYAFTYHSPAWTCRRQTLLRWGHVPCDGEVRTVRCAACKFQERYGCGRATAYASAWLSALLVCPWLFFSRGIVRRRLMFTADTLRFRRACRGFLDACRLVVACCEWSRPLLLANGARPSKLVLCPQGVSPDFIAMVGSRRPRTGARADGRFVIGYAGRITRVKGVDILIRAFRDIASAEARLRILGWSVGEKSAYAEQVRKLAADDPRIELVPVLDFQDMIAAYEGLSLVAVPSVWPETGPLVLFEALGMGVPVWGSRNVGQIEWLRRHGAVIDPNTPEQWKAALESALRLHEAGEWEAGVPGRYPVRGMTDVADDMGRLYREFAEGEESSTG